MNSGACPRVIVKLVRGLNAAVDYISILIDIILVFIHIYLC